MSLPARGRRYRESWGGKEEREVFLSGTKKPRPSLF